ncbi:hypothetical protein KEM56_007353 [Ascosphaera pollenicola]|nr:hypothetical protein KEM56_007353 [Ascosphaera pollenicola]
MALYGVAYRPLKHYTHLHGGYCAPVFEIGRALAERGHIVEFATLEGQESWTNDYEFISAIHLLGAGPTKEQLNSHYLRLQNWNMSKGIGASMQSKYMFDSFWPQTYHHLKKIMASPETRPDMMVADFFAEAVRDMQVEFNLPIATVWPHMPMFMMPCSYIPGEPGFQLEGTTTSEHASLWLRLQNELVVVKSIFTILKWVLWRKKMRNENGVHYPLHTPKKPDFLVFVNSFFGLEIPRDLPPTCAMVGPLLSPTYLPLDDRSAAFLQSHQIVIYIALGTHVILPNYDVVKIMHGLVRLLKDQLIDGVIWSIGKEARQAIDLNHTFCLPVATGHQDITMGGIMSNQYPNFYFSEFVSQRAVLDHEHTKIYFTHGGGSSANEGLYHGKPMISMGISGDQVANTSRLAANGVAEALSKFNFTAEVLYEKARRILGSVPTNIVKDGTQYCMSTYQRNALRLMRIARVAARRKYYAADLVEELLYDHELRFSDDGKELQPMHLQTADMRIPVYKAKNWDLMAACAVATIGVFGSVVLTGRWLLHNREGIWSSGMHLADLMLGKGR